MTSVDIPMKFDRKFFSYFEVYIVIVCVMKIFGEILFTGVQTKSEIQIIDVN
jgi:hypothetical protein